MDLWFVAAAAAAGYLAKYWQNVSRDRDRDSLSKLASEGSNLEKPESPSCPFRRLAQRKNLDKDVSLDRRQVLHRSYSDRLESDGVSDAEVASTSEIDCEKLGSLGNCENYNVLSLSTLPSKLLLGENPEENEGGNGLNGDIVDNSVIPSTSDMSSFHGSARHRSSLRNKNSHRPFVKPVNSLESCLMAQLYPKHMKMEEYVLSPIPSQSMPSVRPLFVTDGSRIISRASIEFGSARFRTDSTKLHKEVYAGKNENVLGVPPLPQIGSLDLPKKMKFKSGKGRVGRLSSSNKFSDGSLFRFQGSQDGTVLFCLGISIGVISSFLTNRREVTKLKELLRQTENLVQDLQEELEMKDSLTVKELANENYESLVTYDNSFYESMPNTFCREHVDIKHNDKELCDKKADEGSESMSKIEAELEAELERMGLNMDSSSLERRLCDCVELDSEFEADFAQGELRADMIKKQFAEQTESDKDASGTSTCHTANFGVSPRELSLRLHEVIQSRLEDRVKELEEALENSQRKLECLESVEKNSWRKFSSSELRYSSNEESPVFNEEHNSMAEPLVMNLSGEALDAYNEAYEELMKINESEEEDTPSGFYEKNRQNGGVNGSSPHLTHDTEKISKEFNYSLLKASEEQGLIIEETLDVDLSGDDNSDFDDEMEKQLIKQIVEKTRKGSPAVLNAQKWLSFLDKDEH